MNMHIRRGSHATLASKEGINTRRKQREKFLDGTLSPTISLIIPAKNEAKNLPWVLTRVPKTVTEVILVDGNSTDNTIEVFLEHFPEGIVLQQKANGKGSALATGLTEATGDVIVMIDADGSMDPIEIHGLVGSLLSGADVVKSSRYVAGGGSDDISHLRNFGNQGLRIVSKVLFGHDWSELAYGYAAFWRDIVPALHLEKIFEAGNPTSKKEYGRGFEIEAILFTRSQRLGLKVSEVFSFEYPRIYGESNLSTFKDGWRVLTAIIRERFTPLPKHPDLSLEPIMVVGSGQRFLSGISHYTAHLANGLSKKETTAVILMRNLIPKILYPGKKRVGENLSALEYDENVAVYNGVDWNGGRSLRGAVKFIKTTHPRAVILQWWTGAVLFNYLRIAKAAVKNGAKVIVEFHEVQDVGEARVPLTTKVVNWGMKKLLTLSSGFIAHSQSDLELIKKAYPVANNLNNSVILHGPYDDLVDLEVVHSERAKKGKDEAVNLMYFGVIRPYKGLDILLNSFNKLKDEGGNYKLQIVGEPWDSAARKMLEEAKSSKYGKDIEIIARYVQDAEIPYLLSKSDVLVLPYLRSSASGPIALAMAAGMPVVTTNIPSLEEVTEGYSGALHVEAGSSDALVKGIKDSRRLIGKKHDNPLSWNVIIDKYHSFLSGLGL